jgi:hypothetical protein
MPSPARNTRRGLPTRQVTMTLEEIDIYLDGIGVAENYCPPEDHQYRHYLTLLRRRIERHKKALEQKPIVRPLYDRPSNHELLEHW